MLLNSIGTPLSVLLLPLLLLLLLTPLTSRHVAKSTRPLAAGAAK